MWNSCFRGSPFAGRGSILCTSHSACLRQNDILSLLSLFHLHLLVMIRVHLLWTLIGVIICGHLLSHHLLEGTVISSFSEFENSLGLRLFLLGFHSLDLIDVWFWKHSCYVRLPACIIELRKIDSLREGLGSISSVNAEAVVYLESLIEDPSKKISTTCWPLNLGSTWCFTFSNFSLSFHIPEVHLSFRNVSKSPEHQEIVKWTNTDGISEPLSKLESRLAICIVHGRSCWLLAWNDQEVVSTVGPLDILNLVVEDRNEWPLFSLMNSDVLKIVLSIVTLSACIVKVLRPNKNSMSRRSW